MRRTYTDKQLEEAVKTSTSWREVLTKLNLKEAGGNYKSTKLVCKRLNLDTSGILGQGWRKGSTNPVKPGRSFKEILVKDSTYSNTGALKRRLIQAGLLEAKCLCCQNNEWLSKPIPLELDHINGISDDHRIGNLRLLCPNCHSQTPTYRGKNIGRLAELADAPRLK